MKNLTFLFCSFLTLNLLGQTTLIEGVVSEKNGTEIIGANLFLVGSYDGTITNVEGAFSFETTLTDKQTLQISYLGFETMSIEMEVKEMKGLKIILRESVTSLDAVEITASTFKAGDNSKVSVLKPLDIVTTAGSNGDVIAALQTLPGTQSNAEDGRLFVRGGDGRESQIFIDGLRVFSPYTNTLQGVPVRGRYSPFLFKGVSFSTGGYSAQFGQALSGILDMQTTDQASETETDISLMTVGVGIGHTQSWDKQSLSINASYIDLTPYYWLAPTRSEWISPYQGFSGEAIYRRQLGKGLLKSYVAGDKGRVGMFIDDLDSGANLVLENQSQNIYSNTTYSVLLDDKTSIFAGISLGWNGNLTEIDDFQVLNQLSGVHAKLNLKTVFTDRFNLEYGVDYVLQNDELEETLPEFNFLEEEILNRSITGLFTEGNYYFSKKLAAKVGLRSEYHSLTKKLTLSPRITLAQKVSKNGQLSLGFGQFQQEARADYLFHERSLGQERATHYLANYNFKNDKHIFRLEGYYKEYGDLVTFQRNGFNLKNISNSGEGSAYGLDLFWRANGLIKYVDFWVSYGWLKHERQYQDFPIKATPSFSTEHNLSLVGKRWMPKLNSQLSLTYQVASGRPYENPNTQGFLNEYAKPYQNLSASWAYLVSPQKILFVSVSNITAVKNEFGYRFASTPDANGTFNSEIIRPNDDQFFFVGCFITISKDKTKNQLDNL